MASNEAIDNGTAFLCGRADCEIMRLDGIARYVAISSLAKKCSGPRIASRFDIIYDDKLNQQLFEGQAVTYDCPVIQQKGSFSYKDVLRSRNG